MLVILLKRVDCLFVHVTDHIHRRQIHVLNGLHDVGKFALGRLKYLEHFVKGVAGNDCDIAALWLDGAQQGALSYDAKRSF